MRCPLCGEPTKVIDSASDCESVYRKRKCVVCGYKFVTTETESDDGRFLSKARWLARKATFDKRKKL